MGKMEMNFLGNVYKCTRVRVKISSPTDINIKIKVLLSPFTETTPFNQCNLNYLYTYKSMHGLHIECI